MGQRFRRWSWLAAVLLLVPGGTGARDEAGQALKALNAAALAAYGRARADLLASGGPVVLFDGENLVLRYGQVRKTAKPTPQVYHDLKAISHVALGLYGLLVAPGDGPLDEARLKELRRLAGRIEAARPAVQQRGLTKEQVERQVKLLEGFAAILAGAVQARRVEVKDVVAAFRKLRPLLDANATDAARAQIDGLRKALEAWRKDVPEKEWRRATYIVQAGQTPRRDHLAVQLFARLAGAKGEGPRVVYAESIFDEAKALRLLGTLRLDGRVGEDLFGDPTRLYRDLLGDAAKAYLDELFKKP
jgi:hypothetical protein